MTHIELGIYGENIAVNHLIDHGYEILDRNFRFKKNEVDIIALKEDQIIFVEVKTRETAEIGEPYKAVTKRKQKQIINVADYYIRSKDKWNEVRFDIISIVHNSYRTKLEHIEHAFFAMM